MPRIEGASEVIRALRRMEKQAGQQTKPVVVAYAMDYADYVHEDQEAFHDPPTQAKYLEAPARMYRKQIGAIISQVYRRTKNLQLALVEGANYLFALSQELVPVDTGALKASGYVAIEGQHQVAAQEANRRGWNIRERVLNSRKQR